MIYILSWLYSLISYFILRNLKSKSLLFSLSLIIPYCVVIFRGSSGTDTQNYIDIISLIQSGQMPNVEYGFLFIIKNISLLGLEPDTILKVINTLTIFLMILVFRKSKEYIFLFYALFFPLFFFDFTMNAVRSGLSILLITHAYFLFLQKRYQLFVFLSLISISLHYSSFLVISLLILTNITFNIRFVFIFLILSSVTTFFLRDRIIDKIIFYASIKSPNILSGVMPLIISTSLFILCISSSKKSNSSYSSSIILISIQILFFILAKYSYVGLRLQNLALYSFIIKIPELINFNKNTMLATLLIGILCFSGKYRNMHHEYGIGPSPFLPYLFYWQKQ